MDDRSRTTSAAVSTRSRFGKDSSCRRRGEWGRRRSRLRPPKRAALRQAFYPESVREARRSASRSPQTLARCAYGSGCEASDARTFLTRLLLASCRDTRSTPPRARSSRRCDFRSFATPSACIATAVTDFSSSARALGNRRIARQDASTQAHSASRIEVGRDGSSSTRMATLRRRSARQVECSSPPTTTRICSRCSLGRPNRGLEPPTPSSSGCSCYRICCTVPSFRARSCNARSIRCSVISISKWRTC